MALSLSPPEMKAELSVCVRADDYTYATKTIKSGIGSQQKGSTGIGQTMGHH